MAGVDPARLYHLLLNTGLQNKDQALYQVVYELIGQVLKLTAQVTSSASGGGAGTTVINQTLLQLFEGSDDSGGGGDTIPGPAGADGANGMVPYFIAAGEIFVIPIYKQALFAMTIDMEGMIDVEGFLIEVDGIEEQPAQQFLGPVPEDCCGDSNDLIPYGRPSDPPVTQTYTPSLTNTTNLDASTAFQCQFCQVGRVVIVSGRVDMDPTTAGLDTQLEMSLPIASNIGASSELGGTACPRDVAGDVVSIAGNSAGDTATFRWIAGDTSNRAYRFIFSYLVT